MPERNRLSRKYGYQILLMEEFGRQGVETLFLRAPQGASAYRSLVSPVTSILVDPKKYK